MVQLDRWYSPNWGSEREGCVTMEEGNGLKAYPLLCYVSRCPLQVFIHTVVCYDRLIASSKASSPQSAI